MTAVSPDHDMPNEGIVEFAGFRVDRRAGGAFRLDGAGAATRVEIGSRALDLLWMLARRPGALVSKREMIEAVWPDTVVEEKNLAMQVSALRKVLEREGGQAAWIQTVPGRGYRFVAPRPDPEEVHFPPVPEVAGPPKHKAAPTRALLVVPASIAALLAIVSASGWLGRTASTPAAYSPEDRRQSIIVLPFENSSGVPEQDSLAADLTRDVTEQVATDPTAPTVPVATAAAYRGKTLELRAVGRAHDVHFALMGNARWQDGRFIVAATLYETVHARQLWSRRFEQPDSPGARARITNSIRSEIDQATMDEDVARAMREHPDSLDKRDLMFASEASSLSQNSETNLRARISLMDRALSLDPNYVWALREKARRHANLVTGGFSLDPDRDLEIANQIVNRALVLAPDDYWVLREKAVVLRAQGRWKEAAAINRRLIERRPLASYRHFELGANLMNLGLHQEALEQFRAARLLAASSDSVNDIDSGIAMALVATGGFPEAIEQARFASQEFTPENGRSGEAPWLALIAAESGNGQEAEARADLGKFLARTRTWRTIELVQQIPSFAANPNLLDGLRRARMPEK